ncbi:hypothetical protein SMCF_2672, partial [Streptomyces coelicoflavus ZG0656]
MNGTHARDTTRGHTGGGRRPPRGRRVLIASVAGAAVLGGVLVLLVP